MPYHRLHDTTSHNALLYLLLTVQGYFSKPKWNSVNYKTLAHTLTKCLENRISLTNQENERSTSGSGAGADLTMFPATSAR